MKMLMLYPPNTYVQMPYLASSLLKGYIESVSSHTLEQIDLNLEYHQYLWSSSTCQELLKIIDDSNEENDESIYYRGLASFLKAEIENSYKALKLKETYKSWSKVNFNHKILKSIQDLVKYTEKADKISYQKLPNTYGEIEYHLDNLGKSFLGKWIIKKIKKINIEDYEIIGISISYSEQFFPALLISKLIKRYFSKNIKIVFGGNITTHYKEELLCDASLRNYIDYVIFYEGEKPLLDLLDQLENKDLNEKNNIAYYREHKVIYKENLAEKPKIEATPDFTGLNLDGYPTPQPIFPILTSKGCYWGKCTYCSHYEGYGQGYFSFKEDRIINIISTLREKFGAEYFYIVDEALPPKNVVRLAKQLNDKQLKIKWFSEARAEKNFSTLPLLKALKESGCLFLIHGLESGNQEISKKMLKGIDLDLVSSHLKICKEVGIGTAGMFFIGFPGESDLQAKDTFKFIEKNYNYLDFASVGVFHLERGTPVYNMPFAYGIEEIIGMDEKYPISFDYKLKYSQEIISPDVLKRKLRGLHQEFSSLNPKFVNPVDRAALPFLKEEGQFVDKPTYKVEEEFEFDIIKGRFAGKRGKLNIIEKKLSILER